MKIVLLKHITPWFAIAKNESYVVYYFAARLRYSTVTRM